MNHCNDKKVHQDDLQNYLQCVTGKPRQRVELQTWLVEAGDKGLHPLVVEFSTAFLEGRGKLELPIIRKGA
jgi:hypothetical protein